MRLLELKTDLLWSFVGHCVTNHLSVCQSISAFLFLIVLLKPLALRHCHSIWPKVTEAATFFILMRTHSSILLCALRSQSCPACCLQDWGRLSVPLSRFVWISLCRRFRVAESSSATLHEHPYSFFLPRYWVSLSRLHWMQSCSHWEHWALTAFKNALNKLLHVRCSGSSTRFLAAFFCWFVTLVRMLECT